MRPLLAAGYSVITVMFEGDFGRVADQVRKRFNFSND
jgi:hypothetical protein